MSFFVTRPPVPVPGTAFGSTPCSAAIRATTGETKVRPLPEGGGAGVSATGASITGASAAAGCGASSAGLTAARLGSCGGLAGSAGSGLGRASRLAPGAITASTVPTSTVSPSWTRISATMPSPGLGISVSTLSVEISSSDSSRAIGSPSDFSHFVIVPSETETPIWGMTTSTCVFVAISRLVLRQRSESHHDVFDLREKRLLEHR